MIVVAVSRGAAHEFSKANQSSIRLLAGLGVEGDAHMGVTVQHGAAGGPNLRQVHLIHAELLDELGVAPGAIGENVTTRGVDLLGLPTGARLHLGPTAVVELTGLRSPCAQIDRFRPGLREAFLGRDEQGNVVRKAGVMAIVIAGGEVRPGDPIRVELPPEPHRALGPV
jgi:MOSC domain-containing protein YiiM